MADYANRPPGMEWQAPPVAVSSDHRLGWVNEACDEGMAWNKSQRGAADWRKALETIAGRDASTNTVYRSSLNTNRLKRNVREVVGALAKVRPMWGYHSDNKAFKDNAEMMNKVVRAWFLEQMGDRSIKDALDWTAVTGRGWIRPMYRRAMAGTGRGDLMLNTYGAPSVLPFQMPPSGDYQSAYAVTYLDEFPVYMAHSMWPTFQDRLRPTKSKYWFSSDQVRRASQGNVLRRIFGKIKREASSNDLADLLVPVRYTYIVDLSFNSSKVSIPMGDPGSSWYYEVPFVGQDIRAGIDLKSGQPILRKADENDARLYPRRRLIISTDNVLLYDGPAFDWHGMFPGVSFCLDHWPWEPLGFALTHDGFEINEAIKEVYRGAMDKIRVQIRPPLTYDTNSVSSREAKEFDIMQPDSRLGYDGQAVEGVPISVPVPESLLKLDPIALQFVQQLEAAMDAQMAISDLRALAAMRAAGSMDDLEKIMEANGPIVEDMSRSMETPIRDLGVMVKYLVLQYFNVPRVMQLIGPDNIARGVFDYDPSNLVPSHLTGENPSQASIYDTIHRARVFADNLRFFVMPNTLHEMTQMVMKLGLLQLRKAGVKISSQTIAESWNVPNYGTFEGSTEIEKWEAEQEHDLALAARAKEMGVALGLVPGAPGGPANGKSNPEGRPNSYSASPELKSKDGGTRSTVTTSK